MISQKKIKAIKALAERGVDGEQANAQAILDKFECEEKERKSKEDSIVSEQSVYFGLALECAARFVRPYSAYWGIAERMSTHIITTVLGHRDFCIPKGMETSFKFSGTNTQRSEIQKKIDLKVRSFITTLEYLYQKMAVSEGINTDEGTDEYSRASNCRDYFLSLNNNIMDESIIEMLST